MSIKLLLTSVTFGLLSVLLFRACFLFKPEEGLKSCSQIPNHQSIKLNNVMLSRFIDALNIPTVSYILGKYEPEQLVKLGDYIKSNFPLINKASFVKRELISNYTILYTFHGANSTLRPYMLTSHLDVVPALDEKWSSGPFNATVKEDGYIYARGTIDAKHLVMSMLEAIEHMIQKGFKPQRTFYLVFGHDEEIGGYEGAATVADVLSKRLKQNNWNQLEYILDEGLTILSSRFPGISTNVALIGVAEKGYVTIKLTAFGDIGHASMPPPETAITKLSKLASKFHSHLLPSFFGQGIEMEMFHTFATHSTWPFKIVYSNIWFFKPILDYILSSNPSFNSLIRTSTAATLISGGTKDNVLPDSASVYINHRIHPLQSVDEVVQMVKSVVNDPSIKLEVLTTAEPTKISKYGDDAYGWQLVKQSLLQVYPGTVVVPGVFLAATDSKWYQNITDSIYKFSAIAVSMDEMKCFHGHDERISLKNYENLINFYHHLVLNSDQIMIQFQKLKRDEL